MCYKKITFASFIIVLQLYCRFVAIVAGYGYRAKVTGTCYSAWTGYKSLQTASRLLLQVHIFATLLKIASRQFSVIAKFVRHIPDFHSLWVLCHKTVWAKLYSLECKIFSISKPEIFLSGTFVCKFRKNLNLIHITHWTLDVVLVPVIILLASVIINSLTHACIQLGCSHMCTYKL